MGGFFCTDKRDTLADEPDNFEGQAAIALSAFAQHLPAGDEAEHNSIAQRATPGG